MTPNKEKFLRKLKSILDLYQDDMGIQLSQGILANVGAMNQEQVSKFERIFDVWCILQLTSLAVNWRRTASEKAEE